jgi:methylglutaconyl-CoA hydratase
VASLVQLDISGAVATITLDSPENRNALSQPLLAELHAALDEAEPAARVIVLSHTDPAFCSGADLRERRAGPVDSTPMVRAMQRLGDGPVPTIAAVRGPARAGGVGLMAACDMVVAAASVTFAFSEIRVGVAPAIISVPLLRRCPAAQLAPLMLTGLEFDAAHALRIGLVSHVVDDPAASAATLAKAVCGGAPGAVAATKALLRSPLGWDAAQRVSDESFRSPEGVEGMAAMAERRLPNWIAQ